MARRTAETRAWAWLVASLVGGACAAQDHQREAVHALRWSDGAVEPLPSMGSSERRSALTALAGRPDGSRVLVRLASPATPALRAGLRSAGLEVETPLGGAVYFAALRPGADLDALTRGGLEMVSAIPTRRKLHGDLAAGVIRPWMVSQTDLAQHPRLRAMAESGGVTRAQLQADGLNPRVVVVVVFHRGVDALDAAPRLAARLGGAVASDVVSINAAVVLVPASRLDDLAEDDAVMWVEPPLPPLSETNAENRAHTGVDAISSAPYLLSGVGVRVMIYDSGRVFAHGDFAGRLVIGASDTDTVSAHSTHVAGTVGGDGAGAPAHQGMAPGVELVSYGFEQGGDGLQAGFLYTDPGDLEHDYAEAIGVYGVDLANNSIGTNIEANKFPCHWTGDYGVTGALIDAVVRGSLGRSIPVVWANGNERSGDRCIGDDAGNHGEYYSTAPPACAKNHITVGAVHADTGEMTWFSSWGPTDDGRIKPDVTAPGCQISGDAGVTSTTASGPSSYGTACGTSMAAPTVAGIAALVFEQWRLSRPDAEDPMNATLKALLANTAVDLGHPGPDYQHGFGSVRAKAAVDAVIAGQAVEGAVTHGGVHRFSVVVEPGEPVLRVTAAWDDVPAAPNVLVALVNDLDLRVVGPGGEVHLPWTLNPSAPDEPAVRTHRDGLNNIEQVQIDAPAPGVYTVEVLGTTVADGPVQRFGASSTGQVVDCASAGTLTLGATVVPCAGSLTVTLRDCDLNLSPGSPDAAVLMVHSTSQPDGIPVALLETGPDTSVFSAVVTFGQAGADLAASDGDVITATYTDANDGTGTNALVEAAVAVDCTPPVIGGIIIRDPWHNSATIEVSTDEPAHVRLRYGLSPDSLADLPLNHPMATTHRLTLTGLTGQTTYYFAFSATDAAGNHTLDDAGGSCYSFRTPHGPEAVHEFLTDHTDPGWSTTGLWAFGQPAGLQGDPASGFTGANVYGYNLLGYYEPYMAEEFLTTGPIDMTGVVETRLDFQRWLGVEPDVHIRATVQARAGGGEWHEVWKHTGGRQQPDEWTLVSYDLSEIADGRPDLQLRWTMGPSGPFADECGWNIDDIVIRGVVLARLCVADLDANGVLNIDDVDAFITAFLGGDLLADVTGDGTLNIDDLDAFVSSFLAGCD